ncbi:hypothetical protein Tco_1396351 [Tanacetum coccineum]
MNITSPSSPLEQTNFALEDRGTNPIDSSIEFSFCTCFVAMEANGSGYGCGLELVFRRLPFYSCPTSGSVLAIGSVMAFNILRGLMLKELFGFEPLDWNWLGVTKIVLLGLEGLPLTSRFIGMRGCVVSEQDELPLSVRLEFRARLDGSRIYSGHLEAMRLP